MDLRTLLTSNLVAAWARHPETPHGQWATPDEVYFSVTKAVDVVVPIVEKLLADAAIKPVKPLGLLGTPTVGE